MYVVCYAMLSYAVPVHVYDRKILHYADFRVTL